VRVIAGSARGRRLATSPGVDVRPTQDRVREAVFSALDARDAVRDGSVLDLYAGSGALGIEALSRGAERAVFVERSRDAAATLRLNLDVVGFARTGRVEMRDAASYVAGPPPDEAPFALVFCDPPYDLGDGAVAAALAPLVRDGWLTADAYVVVERAHTANVEVPRGLRITWQRRFGDTLVTFLQP
jgi:16S rRNA (guanine966-N2)-methyltransferase